MMLIMIRFGCVPFDMIEWLNGFQWGAQLLWQYQFIKNRHIIIQIESVAFGKLPQWWKSTHKFTNSIRSSIRFEVSVCVCAKCCPFVTKSFRRSYKTFESSENVSVEGWSCFKQYMNRVYFTFFSKIRLIFT